MIIRDLLAHLDNCGFEYEFSGDENQEVLGFSDPKDYKLGTAIWIGKYDDIDFTKVNQISDITLVFSFVATERMDEFKNVIYSNNPKKLFMKLVYDFYNEKEKAEILSHFVSEKAYIGDGCHIGRNVIIEENVCIGNNCVIKENSYIGKNCIIGEGCVIGQNVVIGGETNGSIFEDVDGIKKNMPNIGRVVIGKNSLIGAGSIIARGTFSDTVIGDECELNAGTSLGHNCKVGNKTMLLGSNRISGNTIIGERCEIISASIKNRIIIGDDVKVGIGSVIIKDIESGKKVFGNPARVVPS